MTGALETCGRATACVSRSPTTWRALDDVGARLEDQIDLRQAGDGLERMWTTTARR